MCIADYEQVELFLLKSFYRILAEISLWLKFYIDTMIKNNYYIALKNCDNPK